jgi:hypothetical protein
MKELLEYANSVIKDHPGLKRDIISLVELCNDEISQGESSEHEIELCIEDIRQLIEKL